MSSRLTPRDDLRALGGYHAPQLDVPVRLNTNESPYSPPPEFVDAWLEALRAAPLNRYPDRDARALRAALGDQVGQPVERLFCANGSNEVLQTLCLTYGGAGRTAAVFEPTYALHSHIARITGTGVIVGTRREDFTIDLDEVGRVLRDGNPEITFLCSPNNPSGTVDPPTVTETVLATAPGLVVVDEAYGQFAPRSSIGDVSDDGHRDLVVVRTFSKTWSMAAARLGYCVAPQRIVAQLEKVVLPYHLDAMKQVAGRLALEYRAEMDARVSAIVEERGRLAAGLADLPVDVWPSGANFILFRPRATDGEAVWQGLVDRSVLVRNCASWPRLDGCLRVTVGTPAENDAFLAALAEVLS